VLAVAGDHHDVVLALGLHFRQALCDLGRRRDREVPHHVEADVARGERRGLVAAAEIELLARAARRSGGRRAGGDGQDLCRHELHLIR
jgi:hypothetical protein